MLQPPGLLPLPDHVLAGHDVDSKLPLGLSHHAVVEPAGSGATSAYSTEPPRLNQHDLHIDNSLLHLHPFGRPRALSIPVGPAVWLA